jgi:pyruvate formate lyase activating enzyme
MESRPIEIKPFFHFKPASTSMTFSTYSCNLACPWCQNWHISKMSPKESFKEVEPKEIIELALKHRDLSTCASFNEPTLLFEFLLDLFPQAKSKGLFNTMVSNGYITPKALRILSEAGLDAINIDIKGNENTYKNYCGGKAKFVWRTIKKAVDLELHVEIVNLVITNVNDSMESVLEIIDNHLKYAGERVPIHFTRYFPAHLFSKPPTNIETLVKCIELAKKEGIEFAYAGNIRHRFENTYCPDCSILLIERSAYRVLRNRVKDGKCPKCGKELYGVW